VWHGARVFPVTIPIRPPTAQNFPETILSRAQSERTDAGLKDTPAIEKRAEL